MKMYDLRRASAAWAATELARFPVEAHATVSKPNYRALVTATATTRSLNDHDGWQTESFLTQTSRQPSSSARLRARMSGVKPTWCPTAMSPSIGSRSLYRHMLGGPAAIDSRVTTPLSASYRWSTSRGPKQNPHTWTGAAG